jgi:polysaccharide deacetylase family protein (PEP-CTERM system associated)
MLNALTIDVEDWYQSSYDFDAPVSKLCVSNTDRALEFLSRCGTKATFFVQGMVAKAYPEVVQSIHGEGHEVQAHGFSHRPLNKMSKRQISQELEQTKKAIEDTIGKSSTGFRAPDFSIDKDTFWIFEMLIEYGFQYDSSIFPIKTRRYGIDGFERGFSLIQTPSGTIQELPVSVYEIHKPFLKRIPVGGGGYFRLYPLWFLKYFFKGLQKQGLPFIIYCHPYEFNPDEWNQIGKPVPISVRLHQGLGRRGFPGKVYQILKSGSFGTMSEVLTHFQQTDKQN